MKLYLSSYKLGDDIDGLKSLVGVPNASVAVISNARDSSKDEQRKAKSLEFDMSQMNSLGYSAEHIDLREYFAKPDQLVIDLAKFDMLWVTGGNAFILLKAMKQSGFDKVVEKLIMTNKIVYAGFSAALCVIGEDLDGTELVDDVNAIADGYNNETIWEGYGLIDFYPIVHYKSDHPESHLMDKELEYIISKGRKYKTLRDGETIIIDSDAV